MVGPFTDPLVLLSNYYDSIKVWFIDYVYITSFLVRALTVVKSDWCLSKLF